MSELQTRTTVGSAIVSTTALVLLAWVARRLVDRTGTYFSRDEFVAWSTICVPAIGACLAAGLVLVRRPLGRGILVGSVVAGTLIGLQLMAEALVAGP